ncbi:MAG: Gfo/Idh/MocA family oxidoreductase [Fimbriimonadaceae bacterium]|nr:Gfo/Idh/MocA family oxidoreductase [Fimbriimonadaceae bacterium]
MGKFRIGILGAGNIAPAYIETLSQDSRVMVTGIADLRDDRARARAEEYDIPNRPVSDLLGHSETDLIINLTTPDAHEGVGLAILGAGKHLYNEKPFTLRPEGAQGLLRFAQERGLLAGGAPDTVLGGGTQMSRQIIDSGQIGEPVGFSAHMLCGGHESWHPNPEFYYQEGGGPLFDMGPYYLAALFQFFGPVQSVMGATRTMKEQRVRGAGEKVGEVFAVETPTHISAQITFHSGVVGTLTTSFDTPSHDLPHIEVHGTEGMLRAPDPNGFGGDTLVMNRKREAVIVPPVGEYCGNHRGLGAIDLMLASGEGRAARCGGEIAAHIVEVMSGVMRSAEENSPITIESRPERPCPM